jgi:hypothetical protein
VRLNVPQMKTLIKTISKLIVSLFVMLSKLVCNKEVKDITLNDEVTLTAEPAEYDPERIYMLNRKKRRYIASCIRKNQGTDTKCTIVPREVKLGDLVQIAQVAGIDPKELIK